MAARLVKISKYGTCFVTSINTMIKDENGMPNFMTLFYLDPENGRPREEDIPAIFKVDGKIVPGVAISRYFNTDIKGIPCSLPYAMPIEGASYNSAEEACEKKGKGWHLFTNTEFMFLIDTARRKGHKIHGNTSYGEYHDAPEEKGILYDGFCTLTGFDPKTWSHDGTPDGIFGLCGNYWEPTAGLRTRTGRIGYIEDNTAALGSAVTNAESKYWKTAKADGKTLKVEIDNGIVVTDADQIKQGWDGTHYSDLKLGGSLKEIPEILYELGVVARNYKEEKAGIYIDNTLEESVPIRGSGCNGTSNGGAAALYLNLTRGGGNYYISFRSALILENWKLVTEILEGA